MKIIKIDFLPVYETIDFSYIFSSYINFNSNNNTLFYSVTKKKPIHTIVGESKPRKIPTVNVKKKKLTDQINSTKITGIIFL